MDQGLGAADLLHRKLAFFAPMAASIGPTKWQLHPTACATAVHEHLPGIDRLGHPDQTAGILGPDRSEQASGQLALGQQRYNVALG